MCDADSVVICTWSALSTHLWRRSSPHQWDRMGQNDSRRPNECVQLLIPLSPSNVAPLEMIQPLRPAGKRELMCTLVRMCVTVCWKEGGKGDADEACLTAVQEAILYMYTEIRSHKSFLVVCAQTMETCVVMCFWEGVFGKWNHYVSSIYCIHVHWLMPQEVPSQAFC